MDELNTNDTRFMRLALDESKKDPRRVKVGALVVKNGNVLGKAHGEELAEGDHAEYTLLERKLLNTDLSGATLYTTLEPCTTRHHPDQPCAQLVSRRKIKKVVIGILDPNPKIKGQGELVLKRKGIEIAYFDATLQAEYRQLISDWIKDQESIVTYKQLFPKLDDDRSSHLSRFPGLALQDILTIRLCPNLTQGWLMSEVELEHETTKFSLPSEYTLQYKKFFTENYDTFGLRTDNPKIMLSQNPRSYTDAPYLKLYTKETLFSHTLFYNYIVSTDPAKRERLIGEFIEGENRLANFSHILCLHIVVITNDNKILITKRAPDVAWFPNTWSTSFEENMSIKDLEGGGERTVLRWGIRALLEELGITEDVYDPKNLRILSVFLESNILNVGLSGHVVLNIPSDQLRKIIRSLPRADYEFTAWDFLEYKDDEIISEITKPTLPYHPTSRYRLLMALLKKNGIPRGAERFFR